MKLCGIYKITSPSGKIYIGQSPDINRRWNVYRLELCKLQRRLYRSIKKYGWENHKTEVIEICSIKKLNEKEIYWISFYNSFGTFHGMNLTIGGEGSRGHKWTAKAKEKQSKLKTGQLVGDKNGMFGRGHTEETKKLLKDIWDKRRASKKYNSKKQKDKRSNCQIGNKNHLGIGVSLETRNKISKTLKIFYSNKENHPMYGRSNSYLKINN